MCCCLNIHQNTGCTRVRYWKQSIRTKGTCQGVIIADRSSSDGTQRDDHIEWSFICQVTSDHRAPWDGISRPDSYPHVAACRVNHHMFPNGGFHSLSVGVYSSSHAFNRWPVHYQQIAIYFSAYNIMRIPVFQVLIHDENTFVCEINDLLPANTFIWKPNT